MADGIKNKHANIDTNWVDHDKDGYIRTITVDGHEINIRQFQEAQTVTIKENGRYTGLYKDVTVDVPTDVVEQEIEVTANGTYYPAPGKYISKVTVAVFDEGWAKEDIDWSEVLGD